MAEDLGQTLGPEARFLVLPDGSLVASDLRGTDLVLVAPEWSIWIQRPYYPVALVQAHFNSRNSDGTPQTCRCGREVPTSPLLLFEEGQALCEACGHEASSYLTRIRRLGLEALDRQYDSSETD